MKRIKDIPDGLSRMDVMLLALLKLGDYEFVEEMLSVHGVSGFDPLPAILIEQIADVFEERIGDICGIGEA